MPEEYDAFGRKIGEDDKVTVPVNPGAPVAPTPESPATPTPQAPTATAAPTAPPRTSGSLPPGFQLGGGPRPRGSGRDFSGAAVTLLIVVFFGLIGGGVYLAIHKTSSVVNSVQKNLDNFFTTSTGAPAPNGSSTGTPAPTPKPAAPPSGLSRRSLIRRDNLAAAVGKLRHGGLGHLTNLRVAADRVDAQLVTRDGRLRSVQVEPDGSVRKLSISGPGFGSATTIPFSAIDTGAAQRLTSAAAHRHHVSPTKVDYLVPNNFDGQIRWNVYFKDGTYYQADSAGRL